MNKKKLNILERKNNTHSSSSASIFYLFFLCSLLFHKPRILYPMFFNITSPTHISSLLYSIIKNPKFLIHLLNHHHTEQPEQSEHGSLLNVLKFRREETMNALISILILFVLILFFASKLN